MKRETECCQSSRYAKRRFPWYALRPALLTPSAVTALPDVSRGHLARLKMRPRFANVGKAVRRRDLNELIDAVSLKAA
jgi:hypothetical protein